MKIKKKKKDGLAIFCIIRTVTYAEIWHSQQTEDIFGWNQFFSAHVINDDGDDKIGHDRQSWCIWEVGFELQ